MSIASQITSIEEHIGNAYDGLEDLGVDLTNVNKNINNIKACLDNVYSAYPKVTGTGKEVVLSGTKKARMEVVPKGESEQESTTGINLLPNPVTKSETTNGVTFSTDGKGKYTISGKLTNATNTSLDFPISKTYSAGTYYWHLRNGGTTSSNINIAIRSNNSTIAYLSLNANNRINSFTLADETTIDNVRLTIGSGYGTSDSINITLEPTIELTSNTTDYEQFTGGIPAPNPDFPFPVVNVTGNNSVIVKENENAVILPSEYQQVEYIESSGTQYIDTGVIPNSDTGVKISASVSVENSTDKVIIGSRQGNNRFWIDFDGSDINENHIIVGYGNYLRLSSYELNTIYNIEFNLNNNKKVKVNNTEYSLENYTYDNTNAVSLYMFRANYSLACYGSFKYYMCKIYNGSTIVRDFIPCYRKSDNVIGMYDLVSNTFFTNAGSGTFTKGDNIYSQAKPLNLGSIELCKIGDYQDYIYKSGEKWYNKEKIGIKTFTGASGEDWNYISTRTNTILFYINISNMLNVGNVSALDLICNQFINQAVYGNDIEGIQHSQTNIYVSINKSELDTLDVAGFKNYLSTNNLEVYYLLATPTETEITDTTLINQLNEIYKMNSYDDTTIITTTYSNAQADLTVSALKGE